MDTNWNRPKGDYMYVTSGVEHIRPYIYNVCTYMRSLGRVQNFKPSFTVASNNSVVLLRGGEGGQLGV